MVQKAENKLANLINVCLEKNIPFVSYRLPGEQQTITWIQQSGRFNLVESVLDVIHLPGFVYAPFHRRTNYPIVFFEPELIIYNDNFGNDLLKSITDKAPMYRSYENPGFISVSKDEYLKQAEKIISSFNDRLVKAVLSRIAPLQKPEKFDPGNFFLELQREYPAAFCHLIHIPGAGTWTGATPEMLLRMKGNNATTVSLAATHPYDGFGENHQWDTKELEEQQFVNDHLEKTLREFEIVNFKKEKTKNLRAGDMLHLTNYYTFNAKSLKNKLGEFLIKLHPTPAVCGLPKQEALDLIMGVEKHNREYYAGYCGPMNYLDKTDLFVNLRCMKIFPDSLALYVGGGLTAKSNPEKEWEETLLKSQTLGKLL